jgi:pimeloyl-ACP methyl ester carboxylesterase
VRYAAQHPEQVDELVLIDGAYPIAMFDEAGPIGFVVGTGAHSGATEEEMRTVRAAVAGAEASNERVSAFATTPHKHTQILSKAPDTSCCASGPRMLSC